MCDSQIRVCTQKGADMSAPGPDGEWMTASGGSGHHVDFEGGESVGECLIAMAIGVCSRKWDKIHEVDGPVRGTERVACPMIYRT